MTGLVAIWTVVVLAVAAVVAVVREPQARRARWGAARGRTGRAGCGETPGGPHAGSPLTRSRSARSCA